MSRLNVLRVVLPIVFLLALGVGAWAFKSAPDPEPDERSKVSPTATSAASSTRGTPPQNAGQNDGLPPQWVLARPEVSSNSESTMERNSCQTPDPGFGAYGGWETLPKGQLLYPPNPAKDEAGNVRLVFHFHGHESARKEWVQVTDDVVLVALDLGNSSSPYADEFADATRFEALLQSAKIAVEKRLGQPVAIGRFGLSAWSAGYAAVRQILNSEHRSRVDAVILLDGLHASTLDTASGRLELAPFVEFAQRAARNEALMFVSHSSIDPVDYISTTQATNYLIWSLGGNPIEAQDTSSFPVGLRLYRRFDNAGFHALGFRGTTKSDHCAQVSLVRHALQTYVLPRWGLNPAP